MFWTNFRNTEHELRTTLYTRSQPVLFLWSKVHALGTNKDDSNNIILASGEHSSNSPTPAQVSSEQGYTTSTCGMLKSTNYIKPITGARCVGEGISGDLQVSLPWHKALSLAHSWTGPSQLFILCPAINRIHPRHHGAIISQSNLRPAGW